MERRCGSDDVVAAWGDLEFFERRRRDVDIWGADEIDAAMFARDEPGSIQRITAPVGARCRVSCPVPHPISKIRLERSILHTCNKSLIALAG